MDQSPSEQPGVPAAETPQETQRSLTLTIIETAAAVKLLDEAVPDGYAIVKGGIQKAVDKIRDRGPEADPPAQDNDSAELAPLAVSAPLVVYRSAPAPRRCSTW
jgi:hypothetical protein